MSTSDRASYGLKEASVLLGVSYNYLRALCQNRLLTHVLLGNKILIPGHVIRSITNANDESGDSTTHGVRIVHVEKPSETSDG